MAAAAQDLNYRQSGYAVDGSLARELDWAVRERELSHAGEAPRHREQAQEKNRVRTVSHALVRERQQVAAVSVAGAAAVLFMAVLLLMSYIQLMSLSTQTVELRGQLKALETEHTVLATQYDEMFDLAAVRKAAEEAGMTKPSASQVCYLDLSGGDQAVVYAKEDESLLSRAASSLHHGVYAVVEYFD